MVSSFWYGPHHVMSHLQQEIVILLVHELVRKAVRKAVRTTPNTRPNTTPRTGSRTGLRTGISRFLALELCHPCSRQVRWQLWCICICIYIFFSSIKPFRLVAAIQEWVCAQQKYSKRAYFVLGWSPGVLLLLIYFKSFSPFWIIITTIMIDID